MFKGNIYATAILLLQVELVLKFVSNGPMISQNILVLKHYTSISVFFVFKLFFMYLYVPNTLFYVPF